MPRTLEIAIRQAVGKRGVSVVVIPGDVALQPALSAPEPKVVACCRAARSSHLRGRISTSWPHSSTATAA